MPHRGFPTHQQQVTINVGGGGVQRICYACEGVPLLNTKVPNTLQSQFFVRGRRQRRHEIFKEDHLRYIMQCQTLTGILQQVSTLSPANGLTLESLISSSKYYSQRLSIPVTDFPAQVPYGSQIISTFPIIYQYPSSFPIIYQSPSSFPIIYQGQDH